ncbi:hypothetical protein LOK49_LG04G02567 [Camellia lanceoleosa]|uniref:Uncharacterized protein n=1 Tax=Camellia lanceoleosa TaxID=1840588 RepID=A0ACC0I3R8_9ERIC|nr:hypothetical protein LOK49_LG04G02567 [Camellia lanceoleosa]
MSNHCTREVSDEILASNSQSVGFKQQSQIGVGSKDDKDDGNARNDEVAKEDVDMSKNDVVATNDDDKVESEQANKCGFNERLADSVVNEIECGLGNVEGNEKAWQEKGATTGDGSDARKVVVDDGVGGGEKGGTANDRGTS